MKRIFALVLVLSSVVATAAPTTSEVLVLTTATEITNTQTGRRVAVEIQNLGPNAIFCAFSSATAVVNKSRIIAAYSAGSPADSWAIDAEAYVRIWCKAATASQVTGAATIVSELLK